MSGIAIRGWGAVTPAGWGVEAMRQALAANLPLPAPEMNFPDALKSVQGRAVPPFERKPEWLQHARLRRTSPITQYAAAAALEALGDDRETIRTGELRLGIILTVMTGCVNYSRRFYSETLKDPASASPLVFPETVFNAPASHLAALLGTPALNYTLVGDPGMFLQSLALAADWMGDGLVDGCLVVGAEELDWLTVEAARLFDPHVIAASGAGAMYLKPSTAETDRVVLAAITDPFSFGSRSERAEAAIRMRAQLPPENACELLCDSTQPQSRAARDEVVAWHDWHGARLSVKSIFGESFAAGSAWQCVAAADALDQQGFRAANISVVGCNQQAIGARFERG